MKPASPERHILVYADDDEDDLLLVKDAIEPYGDSIDIRLFDTGYAGYHFLLELEKRGEKPCLIILDMNMPGLSGKELLPILRSFTFFDDVPIILFTTSSQEHDYRFALQHKAGFITKPMTYVQMDLIAEQFLSHCTDEVKEKIRNSRLL
jgi:CheY-like chemotaxis protein